jgi:hypothetical protein
MTAKPSVPDQLERDVQRAVMAFYASMGCEVIRFSEGRRTRVTPGWPDLAVFCLRKGQMWVHEIKRPGGQQRPAQGNVERFFQACHVPYLLGGVQAAHDHLVNIGVLEP